MRPVIVIIFSSSIRSVMMQAMSNAKDSAAIIILILLFILYYTIIGYYLFRGTLQGYQNFYSPGETWYQMTILLTTSNFPDIMLPALHQSTLNFFFFSSYLILGLYFLLNLLLATIFSGYKSKMAEKALQQADKRMIYLEKYYNLCDTGNKGYLSIGEARKFFN